mmetsp:Transcript_6994/g.7591  ORF Transcript_6994/g.7591 Transcript_6994/m.7591 type:complete len:136 (-) Transcript_6994:38-445(-)
MQMVPWHFAFTVLAVLPIIHGARRTALRVTQTSGSSGSSDVVGSDLVVDKSTGQSGTKMKISSMVGEMLEGKGRPLHDIVKEASSKINMEEAVHQLDGKLPDDVASLVRLTSQAGAKAAKNQFDEDSMQKARRSL